MAEDGSTLEPPALNGTHDFAKSGLFGINGEVGVKIEGNGVLGGQPPNCVRDGGEGRHLRR